MVLLAGCYSRHEEQTKEVAQLREKLPQLEMPLQFNSNQNSNFKSVELNDNDLINELRKRNYIELVGKVFDTDISVTILGYIPDDFDTPMLITFDNRGQLVNFRALYENPVDDLERHTINIAKILFDRQILFTDSTIVTRMNRDGGDATSTDSVSVVHKKYLLPETLLKL